MCIRDRLLVGLADKTLSTELQLKKDLTLADAIEIARNSEQVKIQIFQQNPARESSKALDEVKYGKRKPFRRSQPQAYSQNNSQVNQNYSSGNRNHQRCTRCDRRHPPNSCPAMRAECNKCHRIGHYAKCCRTRVEKKKKVREVNFDSGDDTFFLGDVIKSESEVQNMPKDAWTINLTVNKQKMTFKIDCGADVTTISQHEFDRIRGHTKLKETRHKLSTAAGTSLKCHGVFRAHLRHAGKHYKETIYVSDCVNNLLSRQMCQSMGIITLNVAECEDYDEIPDSEIFGDIGQISGDPVKIQLKEDAVPFHVHSARRIALP